MAINRLKKSIQWNSINFAPIKATILFILNPSRYHSAYELISTINSDLKQLGVEHKLLFSKTDDANKIVLHIDSTVNKCVISTKLMRILGFECSNLKARKTGLYKFEKISYGRLTSINAFINT